MHRTTTATWLLAIAATSPAQHSTAIERTGARRRVVGHHADSRLCV